MNSLPLLQVWRLSINVDERNKLLRNISDKLGFEHRLSTPYHPQTNGLTERAVQTFKSRIQKSVSTENRWDEELRSVLLSMRLSVQRSTKCTPFELLYGVKPGNGVKKDSDSTSAEESEAARVDARKFQFLDELKRKIEEASKSIEKAQKRQKKIYDEKHKVGGRFKVGEKVLKRNFMRSTRKGSKDEDKWIGSFTVHAESHNGAFLLKTAEGNMLKRSVNGINLK